MNAYDLLECTVASSQEEIKASYHRLLLIHHPDKQATASDSDTSRIDTFLRLQSAFKVLSDPVQRRSYDSLLKQIELASKNTAFEFEKGNYFMLSKDFEFNEACRTYSRKCRCGSEYKVNMNDLNDVLRSQNDGSFRTESLVVGIECDTCSMNINVLIV